MVHKFSTLRSTHPNNDEKNPLDELSFLSASDIRAIAFSSLVDIASKLVTGTGTVMTKKEKYVRTNSRKIWFHLGRYWFPRELFTSRGAYYVSLAA
jgi:hypothetical protein